MNLSSPTYMPTCVTPAPGRAENSRMSPGRSASTTGVSSAPAWAWSRLMRGSRMPCWAYAYWISPEQSNPLSSVPPHTYGVPRDSIAVWTTSPALPLKLVGGSGGGSSGGALYPPLPPQPDGAPDGGPHPPVPVAPGPPESPGSAVLQPIADLRADRKRRDRSPLEAAADAPQRRELLGGRVGREAEVEPGEGIGTEGRAAAPALQLVAEPVERAAPPQRIVYQHGGREPVGERAAEARAGAELVHAGAIAVVPAAEMELHAAAVPLRDERRGNEQQGREAPAPSRRRQSPGALPRRVAPCGGTDRKSTRLNSSHGYISYAVFCLKKKKSTRQRRTTRPARH